MMNLLLLFFIFIKKFMVNFLEKIPDNWKIRCYIITLFIKCHFYCLIFCVFCEFFLPYYFEMLKFLLDKETIKFMSITFIVIIVLILFLLTQCIYFYLIFMKHD